MFIVINDFYVSPEIYTLQIKKIIPQYLYKNIFKDNNI